MKIIIFKKIKYFFDCLKKNRVLYSCIVTGIAFIMFIVPSFAWLTLNRKTNVDEMGMSLAIDDTNAVYEAFMYNLKTGKGTDVDPDNGEKLNLTNIDLNQYDTIFKGQNKYTPIVARIVLIRNQSMPRTGTVYLTVERNVQENEGTKLNAFSSSIVRFTTFILPDHEDVTMGPDALYSHVNTITRFDEVEGYVGNERKNSKTFVNVHGEGVDHYHTKNPSLTIEVDYTEDHWYPKGDGTEALYVYLYITYDVQLVECYMDENGGGLSLEDNSVFFDNDLKKVSARYATPTN